MPRFSSRYPDGAAGIALVLLRFACAWIALLVVGRLPLPQQARTVTLLVPAAFALALVLGFGTRLVAFVVTAGAVMAGIMTGTDVALTMIARACGCAALGLLGPGAYSIDAKLFGRQVIHLEPRGRH